VLEFVEFNTAVQEVIPGSTTKIVARLYRDALENSGADKRDPWPRLVRCRNFFGALRGLFGRPGE
jgi:hypothetical protein